MANMLGCNIVVVKLIFFFHHNILSKNFFIRTVHWVYIHCSAVCRIKVVCRPQCNLWASFWDPWNNELRDRICNIYDFMNTRVQACGNIQRHCINVCSDYCWYIPYFGTCTHTNLGSFTVYPTILPVCLIWSKMKYIFSQFIYFNLYMWIVV